MGSTDRGRTGNDADVGDRRLWHGRPPGRGRAARAGRRRAVADRGAGRGVARRLRPRRPDLLCGRLGRRGAGPAGRRFPRRGRGPTSATRSWPSTGEARVVRTASGRRLPYDALVLATGSTPFVPPVPGHDLPGCFVYRTIDDLDAIRDAVRGAAATTGRACGVVVGGGLLGLEAANALRGSGCRPHVVEIAPRLMPMQVDEGGGALLRRLVETLGVRVHTGVSTAGHRSRPRPAAGRRSPTAPSSTPTWWSSPPACARATSWPASAGLAVGERGGIAGRRALPHQRPGRLRDRRVRRCRRAASTAWSRPATRWPRWSPTDCSAATPRSPAPTLSTKLKLLGVDVASFGDAHAAHRGRAGGRGQRPGRRHATAKLVVSDDAATLLGGILVGDASDYATLRPMVGARLPGDPGALIAPAGGGSSIGVDALPAGAQICSCNTVTKGEIIEAAIADGGDDRRRPQGVHQGRHQLRLVRADAEASCSTACGVEQSNGAVRALHAQSRASCSRSSRATGIRTFSELVDAVRHRPRLRHLQARGRLDPGVARPAGTSSTASRPRCRTPTTTSWPTCSATAPTRWCRGSPAARSPPSKLIVIGEVARDFGLYTKITGGQRIDLFGATRRPAARRSGAGWSTPGSSPGTPTARRCAR